MAHEELKKSKKAYSRIMEKEGEKRSGSDSNAHSGRKQERLHEDHKDWNKPQPQPENPADFAHDLNPNFLAGENHGQSGQEVTTEARSAYDIKELHDMLSNLTDDELRNIMVLCEGARLEQGARYLDLRHPERGEFVALANMVAGPDNYYVPKKDTDYVLWNRLIGVTNPERLDEE
jgi:hypothetical protein